MTHTESGFGRLEDNDKVQAEQIATLTDGMEKLRGVVADLQSKACDMQDRQISMEGVQTSMKGELSRNTEITEYLWIVARKFDAVGNGFARIGRGAAWIGRTTRPILGWITAAAAAVATVIAAIKALDLQWPWK
jgi:predicted phage tail protein